MVVSGNVSLVFIDDMTDLLITDRSRRLNCDANSLVRFSKMLQNQSDSASKCKWIISQSKLQSKFLKSKTWNVLQMPRESPELSFCS